MKIAAILFAGLLAACSAAPSIAQQPAHSHGEAATSPNATVAVRGPDGKTLEAGAAMLKGLPRATLTRTIHGKTQVFEGALLGAVLETAGAPSGEALRGKALSLVVLVRARDGYQVALSLAEVDPRLGGSQVILADTADGKPIGPEDGPYRLIVEGDRKPARSARMVSEIVVRAAE
jgi:hypothetical protein